MLIATRTRSRRPAVAPLRPEPVAALDAGALATALLREHADAGKLVAGVDLEDVATWARLAPLAHELSAVARAVAGALDDTDDVPPPAAAGAPPAVLVRDLALAHRALHRAVRTGRGRRATAPLVHALAEAGKLRDAVGDVVASAVPIV